MLQQFADFHGAPFPTSFQFPSELRDSPPEGAISSPELGSHQYAAFGANPSYLSTVNPGHSMSFSDYRRYKLSSSDVPLSSTFATSSLVERKISSFVAIAPNNRMPAEPTHSIVSPSHIRRSSLLGQAQYENPFVTRSTKPLKSSSFGAESLANASSLVALSPSGFSGASPTLSESTPLVVQSHLSEPRDMRNDPLALLHWLTQIDLSKFGYMAKPESKSKRGYSVEQLPSFTEPSLDEFGRIECEFLDAVRRRSRATSSAPDIRYALRSPVTPKTSAPRPQPKTPTTPRSQQVVPRSPSTPRIPYKGRFGTHPTCGSCKTTKTPYWRDSWSDSFILCNACGLRYSKFKRYCRECSYVPRKEDKGALCCTQCSSAWSYKA